MTPRQLLEFAQRHSLAVQASVASAGAPQAAVIGIVADAQFELFFVTLQSSRKCQNLRRDPRIALVVGWDLNEACTLQLEGSVDEPGGQELERWLALYFERFPEGRQRHLLPDVSYFRVRPSWLRFSDFRGSEPTIVEFSGEELRRGL